MIASRRRVVGVLGLFAVLAGACADDLSVDELVGPELEAAGFEVAADPTTSPSANANTIDPALIDGARIVDDECYLGEARCGRVQVSQSRGSDDRIEIGFRIVRETSDPVPVVVLRRVDRLDSVPEDAFAGRTVVEVGERGVWPGSPAINCPEWEQLSSTLPAEITEATERCRARLAAAGVDVGGDDLAQRADDVITLVGALGYREIDLVAPARRAGLVGHVAEAVSVRRVAYVEPFFAGTDPIANGAANIRAALDLVWSGCAAAPDCSTVGSVDDFLDAIGDLDAAPIPELGVSSTTLDQRRATNLVIEQLETPRSAVFLPELHRMLVERDADRLGAILDASYRRPDDSGFTLLCRTSRGPVAGDVHPTLTAWAEDAASFYAAACAVWAEPAAGPPAPIHTDQAVIVASASWRPVAGAEAVPTVIEPSVVASPECVWSLTAAWFDDAEIVDDACTTTLSFETRTGPIVSVSGEYVYDDDTTVQLPVPQGWDDNGNGTWVRAADPLDVTLLDVWVWESDTAETARAEMIVDWAVEDPLLEEITVGASTWFIATGLDGLAERDNRVIVAVAEIEGRNVALVMTVPAGELADLRRDVLDEAMAGATIR